MTCKSCRNESDYLTNAGLCRTCFNIQCTRDARKIASGWWYKNVPPMFRKTNFRKLPDRKALREVLYWWRYQATDSGSRWLYVHGNTGLAKTRVLYQLMRMIVRDGEPGETHVITQGGEFRHEIVNRTKPREKGERYYGSISDYLEELCGASTLWFDEIDKLKFSERVLDEFFGVIDHRYRNEKTTIFSGPIDLLTFKDKMGFPDGPQVARRILQMSKVIEFMLPSKPARSTVSSSRTAPTRKLESSTSSQNPEEHENETATEVTH